jgi:DNA-binding response OmpR family regulator
MAQDSRSRILIVDDDTSILELSVRALRKSKFDIVMADRMEEALAGFGADSYDLVITDIFMPGLGGIEGIRKMREAWPEVKILAISAGFAEMSSASALDAARKIGADAVLPKPFGPAELRDAVSDILGAEI